MIGKFATAILGVALATFPTERTSAQSLPTLGQSDSVWRYTLGIYSFLPLGTTGTSTIAGTSVPIDLHLGDIRDLLDWALASRVEAWNVDLSLIFNAKYASIGADGPLPPATVQWPTTLRSTGRTSG